MKSIKAVDLFCGAGGASSSLLRAAAALGLRVDLLAVNHWKIAIETHSLNHPEVRHICDAVQRVNPREAVPGGRLQILLAGPECTNHSRARGGRPVNDQSRATAWDVLKWCQELYVENVLIENVEEFREWGPLGANNKPMRSKRGETYRAFLEAFRSLGYSVEDRVLNAADYGDPTTRRRLFIIARRGKRAVSWPSPTHSKAGAPSLFGTSKKWRAAREIIDWSIESRSIFDPARRPLSPKTLARIYAGLERFGGEAIRPFLVILRNHADARSIDEPVPAIAAQGQHIALCEPFLMHLTHGDDAGRVHSVDGPVPTVTAAHRGELGICEPFMVSVAHGDNEPGSGRGNGGRVRSVAEPLPTVSATGRDYAVCEPFVLQQQSGGAPRSTDQPLPTIATDGAQALVQPFLVPHYGERVGQVPRTHSVEAPMPTIPATGSGKFDLVEPFIVTPGGPNLRRPSTVEAPLPTVTGSERFAVVEPFIIGTGGPEYAGTPKSVDDPLGTVMTFEHKALIEPSFIASYYGTKNISPVSAPLPTVTTKDRFALVMPVVNGRALDIRLRMLRPHELAGAMSFPRAYRFAGNQGDQVKQIGNAWAGELGTALNTSLIQDYVPAARRLKEIA